MLRRKQKPCQVSLQSEVLLVEHSKHNIRLCRLRHTIKTLHRRRVFVVISAEAGAAHASLARSRAVLTLGGCNDKPEYTVHANALTKHSITTAADIVAKMRNPGPGMIKFGVATIPDKDATAIAEYVLKTFT